MRAPGEDSDISTKEVTKRRPKGEDKTGLEGLGHPADTSLLRRERESSGKGKRRGSRGLFSRVPKATRPEGGSLPTQGTRPCLAPPTSRRTTPSPAPTGLERPAGGREDCGSGHWRPVAHTRRRRQVPRHLPSTCRVRGVTVTSDVLRPSPVRDLGLQGVTGRRHFGAIAVETPASSGPLSPGATPQRGTPTRPREAAPET